MAHPLHPDAVLPFIPVSIASTCEPIDHWLLKQPAVWAGLEKLDGKQYVSPGSYLEMANCPGCNSTLAVEVRTIPACSACGGEGAVLDEHEREVECGFCSGSGDATQAVVL
jgi:hypothetical protein